VTTLTLVPKAPLATEHPRRATLLSRFLEHIVRHPWPEEKSLDRALARAIDEAFESLAREART
jgi:hypothetical protein